MSGTLKFLAASVIALQATFASSAIAQDSSFALELNNASEIENGCRLTYVATNNTGIALTETSYEVAIFDAEGRVQNLLVLEFGQLPVAKTRVVQFDLPALTCGNISRIVVNNLAACVSADGTHDVCLSSLVTSSRTDMQFGV